MSDKFLQTANAGVGFASMNDSTAAAAFSGHRSR